MLLRHIFILTKRNIKKISFDLLLLSIITITLLYVFLPEKSKSASINVPIYLEDQCDISDSFKKNILSSNSLYNFYFVDSEEILIDDVKKKNAHCGFYFPKDFFNDFINKQNNINIITYSTPETTLLPVIKETLYANLLQSASIDILFITADLSKYNDLFREKANKYILSESIFKIKEHTSDSFIADDFIYKIDIPLNKFIFYIIFLSGFFGVLNYLIDQDDKMFFSVKNKFRYKIIYIISWIFPVFIVSLLSIIIYNGFLFDKIISFIVYTFISFILSFILCLVYKKSTSFSKVLPIIIIVFLIYIFSTKDFL